MSVVAAAGISVLVGAILQAVTGFGFALLVAPVLALLLGPRAAIADMAIIGVAMHVVLVGVRLRGGRLRAPQAPRLLAWAVPGVVAGALALGVMPPGPVLLAIGIASLGGVLVLSRGEVAIVATTPAAPAGLAFGVLTTLTGVNGPALVLHLLRRGVSQEELRDTMFTCFLALSPVGIAALVLVGAWAPGPEAPVLALCSVLGAGVGARARRHVDGERLRGVTLVLLAMAGVVAIVGAVAQW